MADDCMTGDEPVVALIEDEPFVRDVAASELMEHGFRVVEFASADAALPWLESHGGDVAVLVTDVQMPGKLNGLELVSIVRQLWPSLAMLVTSGGPLVNPSRLPPLVRFVPKPWRPVDLANRVAQMARY